MKFLLVPLALFIFSTTCVAQDICGELQGMDTSFTKAFERVYNESSPSASDRKYLKELYFSYRKFLVDNNATGIAALVGLKIVTQYGYVLFQEKKIKEGIEEVRFGLANFLEHIERSEARCYVAFKGNISYEGKKVEVIVDNFLKVSTLLSFELNEPSLPQQILMKVAERDLIGSNSQMNMAAHKILKYKIKRQEIDDTCFYAAYAELLSDYEEKSVQQAIDDLNDAIDNLHSPTGISAMKIITDPKLISYRPPMVKRYKYLNFYEYYIRLYKYLAQKGTMQSQHSVLKMFLQTFNADKNGGINVDFLTLLGRGSKTSPDPIRDIIKTGDTELMQLLADFIWKYCSSSKYDDIWLIYGGYLCYYNLGDKKMAGKIYKRLGKNPDERFPKLN
ncbi:MAG: hypothetical protein ABIR78_10545 [Ferruginibacter sp.]